MLTSDSWPNLSLENGLVDFLRSAQSGMAHKFSIRFISGNWLGHGKHFIPPFARQSFVFLKILYIAWKGRTTTQLSTMKHRQQPLIQNVDIFFNIDISPPSQTTSSKRPAVQMAQQTITEKPPNLTVGCRCRKENSWDGNRRQTQNYQIWLLSENCANRDSSEKTTVSQNSTSLLIISDPHCFLCSMLKGRRSGFLLAALPRYQRAWR